MLTCVTFDNGWDGVQGLNWLWVLNSGVQVMEGRKMCRIHKKCGYFDGQSNLEIPFFSSGYDSYKEFALSLFYKRFKRGRRYQGLVSNDCFQSSPFAEANSLYVSTPNRGHVSAGLRSRVEAAGIDGARVSGIHLLSLLLPVLRLFFFPFFFLFLFFIFFICFLFFCILFLLFFFLYVFLQSSSSSDSSASFSSSSFYFSFVYFCIFFILFLFFVLFFLFLLIYFLFSSSSPFSSSSSSSSYFYSFSYSSSLCFFFFVFFVFFIACGFNQLHIICCSSKPNV